MDADPANATVPPELDNPLWQYALALWSDSTIEALCLALQQRGWSVTRILCACWLASRGRMYSQEPAPVNQWRQRITQPLRALRQHLPRNDATVSRLRSRVAMAELEAERVELALAYGALPEASEAADAAAADAVIWSNLRAAAPQHDIDADTRELMTALIQHLSLHSTAHSVDGTTPCAG
ncbi:TIGR02444 family protein [Marinobacter sp. SS21]|uniref:TIGR02444 family protein n=1 Tax=Marinobacter sp. SS21 TaxID=2979460 RepID=UPI002330E877|nr:TIGR02444 family protein [Marinobacter sp. SS21]MDC0661310.1 TIGR02444 family protein [Marinobacter sp. SS21]